MRTFPRSAMLVALTVFALAADKLGPHVELYRSGLKNLTAEDEAKIVAWSEKFLESANFNTANHPDILKQSVANIQEHYRKNVRGDYLVVSYDHPRTFKTAGGDVAVLEIIVGLGLPDSYASGLFTIDPQGRVVQYAKYYPMLPPELSPQPATREGL